MENHVPVFEEFIFEEKTKKLKSIKKKILDYAEKKGRITSKEIRSYFGYDPRDRSTRGRGSSYVSGKSSWIAAVWEKPDETTTGRNKWSHGLLMRPTKKDPRYLVKDEKTGDYHIKIWDGEKIDEKKSSKKDSRNAYECMSCGERAEPEEIEENPNMRCSNCGATGEWESEH